MSEPTEQQSLRNPTFTFTTFWKDVAYTFFFFVDPRNLVSFCALWFFNLLALFFLSATAMTRGLSLIFALVLSGWLFAYYLRIIEDTVGNEDTLPETTTEGLYETFIQPWLVFAGTWAMLLSPSFLFALLSTSGNIVIPPAPYQINLVVAVVLWPMAILCVSIGGVQTLLRIDLILVSIVRTIGPYLLICGILLATGFAALQFVKWMSTVRAGGTALIAKHPFASAMLLGLLLSYVTVVAMRLIGLYYRHFKHRFAWSWE